MWPEISLLPPCLLCHDGLPHQTASPNTPFSSYLVSVRYQVTMTIKVIKTEGLALSPFLKHEKMRVHAQASVSVSSYILRWWKWLASPWQMNGLSFLGIWLLCELWYCFPRNHHQIAKPTSNICILSSPNLLLLTKLLLPFSSSLPLSLNQGSPTEYKIAAECVQDSISLLEQGWVLAGM